MKPSIFTLFLFVLVNNLPGQNVSTDHLSFQRTSDSTKLLYDRINVKDTNSLVIVISRVGLWTYGQFTDVFIFRPHGNITCLEMFESSDLNMTKSYHKEYRLTGSCLDSIKGLIEKNNFDFNSDSLEIMPEPVSNDSVLTILPTWDGLHYLLGICKGNQYSEFMTQSPEIVIKARAVGYTEKEKFLNLVRKFDKIKSCCQQ